MRKPLLKLWLASRRLGWTHLWLALLSVCSAGLLGQNHLLSANLASLETQLGHARKRLIQTEAMLQSPEASIGNLERYQNALGTPDQLEETLLSIFTLAKAHQITLPVGTYNPKPDAENPNTETLKLSLPTQGRYPDLRQFCEAVLRKHAFVSLDQIQFSRNVISSQMIESQIELGLHMRHPPASSSGVQP